MIALDNFESCVPYRILLRGEEYYEIGAVSELEEDSPGEWTATVEGTENYNVEISMDGKEIKSWYCDCPYDGEICKHIVATLLAIRDNEKKVNRSASSKVKVEVEEAVVIDETVDIQQLLSFANPQELSQFIYEYASMHPEFKTALLNRFMAKELSATSKEKDYRAEIQNVFNDSYYNRKSRYHNRYDDFDCDWETVFNRMDIFLEKADFFLNVGNIDTTIDIALQTLRSIGENYEDGLLYNDDLYPSDYCEQAGDLLIKVIEHPKTTQKQKTAILQELGQLAKLSTYRDYDLYDIDELLMQINLSIQPAEKTLELIDKLLEERKDTYDLYQIVLRKVNLLTELHEEQKAADTIRQYLYLTEIREMEVDKLIASCQYDEAIRLLNEGIEIAEKEEHIGTVEEWLKTKLRIYEMTHQTAEVINTCRLLFVSGRDQLEYYSKLKTLVPKEEWKSFLDTMMKETQFSEYFSFDGNDEAEIYVKERDYERLFKLLSSIRYNQLEALMKYSYHLKDTHSEQLIAIYTSLLNDYAEQNVGRTHYELIAQALLCAKKLNGGQEAVKRLVAEFRIKYKRRPAMMEVLRRF
ncbi:SWIM zinc finger domain-containing protein [Bacteroides finegoldii]|uniref:SWIM zinc finger family protein n=1 Tax=Bacteroides finegoldii TaxID=338188 RepID=UPI00189A2E23|nr:SWIM zinc finger family protein [Bacteroides finegoldii]